jgi:CBS domain containing-hemolysin-like protein
MMSIALALSIAAALVLVNACFVAAEFAIVTVRRSRIETLVRAGSRRARFLEAVTADLDSHISAIQLAITSVSIAIGWLAEPAVASVLVEAFGATGVGSAAILHSVAFAVAFCAITMTVIIAGELAPKFLGLRRTEGVALATAPLVYGFARMTRPVLHLMNSSAGWMLRVLGVTEPDPSYEKMDAEELRVFLSELSKLGRLSPSRRKLLENVFEFAQHTARQIMVPRDRIDYLSLERSLEENLATVTTTGHTRYPLCETGLDSVVGMVHIKDVFQRASALHGSADLRLIQHDMLFVPESQPIDVLQSMFQKSRSHMAMVVDEYGVPTGLVTMEDVLEELVGEIRDEFDAAETPQIERGDDGILVDGMLLVEDLCRELEIEVEATGADTIGGYVINKLGRIPRTGDRFKIDGWEGRVAEMQGRRVARVMLRERKKRSGKEPRKLGAKITAPEQPTAAAPASEPKAGPAQPAEPPSAIPLQKVSGRRE